MSEVLLKASSRAVTTPPLELRETLQTKGNKTRLFVSTGVTGSACRQLSLKQSKSLLKTLRGFFDCAVRTG